MNTKRFTYSKLILLFVSLSFFSCTTSKNTLYEWGDYNNASYIYLKNSDDEATSKLLKSYENIINKAESKGKRGVAPPGIYADYGFLLIKLNRRNEGIEMLNKEISLYPESKVLVAKILSLIEL